MNYNHFNQRLLWVAVTLLMTMTVLTSCTDDNSDNPVVVTDDKPFPYGTDIDETVRPGDDFYRYVNGLWLNSPNPAPSMMKQVEDQLDQLSDDALATSRDPLLVMLRSQADATLSDDSRDVALLKERLQMLEQIETADQLHAAFGTLYELGYSPLFRLIPFVNEGKKTTLAITTGGMPDEMLKEVFMRQKPEKIDSLVRTYCQPLTSLGYTPERVAEIIKNAIAVETAQAQCYVYGLEMVKHQLRAPRRTSEDDEFNQKMGAIFEMMGLTSDDFTSGRVIYSCSEIFQLICHLASVNDQENINAYRDYMIYNVVAQDAPFVPSANAQADRKAMLQRALQYNRYYKYRVTVENYGRDNIYKQECQEILERMRQIFIQRIDSLDWMSDATKVEARKKAEAMKFYIGYPDQWDDAMTPAVSGDCLLETATQLRQDALRKNYALTSKNFDENAWDVWAIIAQFTTDNAFYQRTANCLVILPAWITRPRFDSSLSESTYYTTSYVFAHEFCHGFDANGSLYDADGIKRDWWEPADREAFQQKQQAMIDLFSQLEDYPGVNANGQQTLDENMADYGGIELALECYKQRLKEQGFTGAQFDEQIKKFFISFAAFWKMERELSLNELKHYHEKDTHALAHVRINGQVRLQADWYRLFDVQPTDKLYLAPEDRVKIW